jgi:hydroxyethylthiazole kinase-like uncharacterized protein yjeF
MTMPTLAGYPVDTLVPLLEPDGVRLAEQAIMDKGLSLEALLEGAAERCWSALARETPAGPWLVLTGPGHNGADGWAIARKAAEAGVRVEVASLGAPRKPLTESQRGLALAQGAREVGQNARERFPRNEAGETYVLVVDAMYGFGQSRPIPEDAREWIETITDGPRVVSIDVPSGLDARTGKQLGATVRADETLVLGSYKTGLLCDNASRFTGRQRFVPLGMRLRSEASEDAVFTASLLPEGFARRQNDEHKLTRGEALLVAGDARYPGAGILALEALWATRPGYVRVSSDSGLSREAILSRRPETVLAPAWHQGIAATDLGRVRVVVVGCGMEAPDSQMLARFATTLPPRAVVVADGAWTSARALDALRARCAMVIATPHTGEFAHMAPESARSLADGELSKAEAAREAARATGCYLVLKGPFTAVATPHGRVLQSPLAAPSLARAGSGDVLAGWMGGILLHALHMERAAPLENALATAVYLHAVSGVASPRSALDHVRALGDALFPRESGHRFVRR